MPLGPASLTFGFQDGWRRTSSERRLGDASVSAGARAIINRVFECGPAFDKSVCKLKRYDPDKWLALSRLEEGYLLHSATSTIINRIFDLEFPIFLVVRYDPQAAITLVDACNDFDRVIDRHPAQRCRAVQTHGRWKSPSMPARYTRGERALEALEWLQ